MNPVTQHLFESEPDQRIQKLDDMKREFALKALARTNNTIQAAKLLGITDRCLHRWKARWGIVYSQDYGRYIIKKPKDGKILLFY